MVVFFLKILDSFQMSFPAGCFLSLEGRIEAAFGAFFVLLLLFFQIKRKLICKFVRSSCCREK